MVCIWTDSGLQLVFASTCASWAIMQFALFLGQDTQWQRICLSTVAVHIQMCIQYSGISHNCTLDVQAACVAYASVLRMLHCLAVVCTGGNASSKLKPHTTSRWAKTPLSCRWSLAVQMLLKFHFGQYQSRVAVCQKVCNWSVIHSKLAAPDSCIWGTSAGTAFWWRLLNKWDLCFT